MLKPVKNTKVLILNYLLYIAIILLMLPVFILFLQIILATFNRGKKLNFKNDRTRPSFAVLMPAHNESLVIAQSIETIKPQLTQQDSLTVIADNCTDDTAAIARNLGVTVIERIQKDKRGKGYALDFGLQYLKDNPPDIVIIVDADCLVEENCLERLVTTCMQSQRPVQALYLMESQPNPSLKARIATFAWTVKNKVRPLGFSLLGLPCQLMGTGMAFLWTDINKTNLASGHIVEDMKLGTDLARLNKAPLFLDSALVTSIFPPDDAAVRTQRARWEHGHLSVILSEVPILLFEAVKYKNLQMLGLACDLLVPPLAMLSIMCLIIFIVSIVLADKLAIILSIGLLGGLLTATFTAWAKFGRNIISFKQLCYAPIYALVKVPLYIKFFLNRQVEWIRSKRD